MLKMSTVKVNPKFGTCRLCLEDMGQYLILEKVQEQIKYCFDINVEPFDGLPQLLCKSCEDILKQFFEIKKKIVDKQNDLINNKGLKNAETQHLQDTDEPSLTNNISEPSKPTVAKSKQIVLSFSCKRLDQPSQCTAVKKNSQTKKTVSWLSHYKKEFACKLCNYRGNKKQTTLKHIRTCHKSLKTKYEHVLKNNCKIELDKLDKMPNITGLNEFVVITAEKIVQDIDSSYCIIYTPKDINRSGEKHEKSDISDDDCNLKKKRKISNDTLASKIEEQQISVDAVELTKGNINENCIKTDDSSENKLEKNCNSEQAETDLNNTINMQNPILTDVTEDHKCKIQNIISICHNKYKKNLDLHKMHRPQHNNPALSKSQLKHKVLSIGRKIINKQGFNCTGLLRYMEHRNLEIVWTPNSSNFNSDTNYVRIMTKLKGNAVDEDDLGWKMLPANQVLPTQCSEPSMPKISQVFYSERNAHWKEDTKNKLLNKNPVPNPKQMPRKVGKHNESVPVNLIKTYNNEEQDMSNANEFSAGYTKPEMTISIASQKICENKQYTKAEHTKNDIMPPQSATDNDTELSTGRIKVKPLAELLSKEGLMNTFNVGNPTTCNPLSENSQSNMFACLVQRNETIQPSRYVPPTSYMAPLNHINLTSARHLNQIQPIIQPSQVLQTIDNTQINYPIQAIIQAPQPNVNLTTEITQKDSSNQKNELNQVSQVSQEIKNPTSQKATEKPTTSFPSSTGTEFVIMDTKELPSVVTSSPIQYFGNLLNLHNIHLIDKTSNRMTHFFVCLIRFKVLYKQDTMEEPILLSLSLFCYKNQFCIRVKNMNLECINISEISASWQWEIIKVFKGEVANKMLQNAQNVNEETYTYADKFLTLLKSIKYTKV